jgi:hypothetical protein
MVDVQELASKVESLKVDDASSLVPLVKEDDPNFINFPSGTDSLPKVCECGKEYTVIQLNKEENEVVVKGNRIIVALKEPTFVDNSKAHIVFPFDGRYYSINNLSDDLTNKRDETVKKQGRENVAKDDFGMVFHFKEYTFNIAFLEKDVKEEKKWYIYSVVILPTQLREKYQVKKEVFHHIDLDKKELIVETVGNEVRIRMEFDVQVSNKYAVILFKYKGKDYRVNLSEDLEEDYLEATKKQEENPFTFEYDFDDYYFCFYLIHTHETDENGEDRMDWFIHAVDIVPIVKQ